jgi:hypothetical protein
VILFLIIAALFEFVVVLYTMSLGVQDPTVLQWNLGAGTLVISPLFHLVPIAVILALAASWTYLTRYMSLRTSETWKGKAKTTTKQQRIEQPEESTRFLDRIQSGVSKIKTRLSRASLKSAVVVLLTFIALILLISVLAYPQLIYQTLTGAFQRNPSLLGFVQGTGQALASVGAFFAVINGAFLYLAPGFRNVALGFGRIIAPLANLDAVGKYLVLQNIAVWFSALSVLFFAEYRKRYRFRRGRRS